MSTYIVGQTRAGQGSMVMKREQIGDVEVYVEHVVAPDARQADEIARALNRNEEVPVAPPLATVHPLYAGTGED